MAETATEYSILRDTVYVPSGVGTCIQQSAWRTGKTGTGYTTAHYGAQLVRKGPSMPMLAVQDTRRQFRSVLQVNAIMSSSNQKDLAREWGKHHLTNK